LPPQHSGSFAKSRQLAGFFTLGPVPVWCQDLGKNGVFWAEK